jgi:ACS family hexuronate transporter-like MFS transporter
VPELTTGGNYTPFFILGILLLPLTFAAIWLGGPVLRVPPKH